jgi:GT2 family glycosyltransferase
MLVSRTGGILVVGWLDDMAAPLDHIRIAGPGWFYTFDASSVVRFRRSDVEAALGSSSAHGFGFLAFAFSDFALDVSGGCDLVIVTKGGGQSTVASTPRLAGDVELRDVILSRMAESEVFGDRQIEAMRTLDGPIGREIIKHNLRITRDIVAGACVERFGQPPNSLRGSIIVCLYGKPEYLFLQNAMFAGCPGFEDYELVYVSNSAEMSDRLLKEARAAQQVYGLPQTVVLLPENAGFAAANNAAVNHAASNRLLIVNPDVFPRDRDWAQKHTQIVANLPLSQTRIFGVPLCYDDGSLMHGGMYFEADTGVSIEAGRVSQRHMLRVEHYGKGAPAWASQFTRPRPIQAVTGAFISLDRSWFETLGGFTENYVFGHYEDADLCLKSIQKGRAPWIHDIRMWHLEGKGSLRLPVHEGGSLVNRWLFTKTWREFIADGLYGPEPTSPMFLNPQPVVAGPMARVAEATKPAEPGVRQNASDAWPVIASRPKHFDRKSTP